MNDFDQVIAWLERLERGLSDHVMMTRNMFKVGPVVDRDKDKGVRLQSDEGNGAEGEEHKEPWGQPAERSGVERYVPRKGQTCLMLAPYGDAEQGIVLPFGHSDDHPNPAEDVDEVVMFKQGKVKVSVDKAGTSMIFQNDKTKTVWGADKITQEVDGKAKTVWSADKIEHTVDGNTTTFEKDTVTFPDGSKVRHGDRNIGRDHVHGGVMKGAAKTSDPDA